MLDVCELLGALVQCLLERSFTASRAARAKQIAGTHQQSRKEGERIYHGRTLF
jgi:hypothetical protein